MSKNRRYQRAIKLDKVTEALIREDKNTMGQLYFALKAKAVAGGFRTVLELREALTDLMKEVKAKCLTDYAKIAYGRAILVMLQKVGGPVKSADDLFDEAMGNKADGPSEESIQECMKILGMEAPPYAPGAPADASASAGTGSPGDSPAPSRLPDRSDPPVPPGEGAPT